MPSTGSRKPYLFNADNVARYAPASWHSAGSVIDASYESLDRLARQPGMPSGVEPDAPLASPSAVEPRLESEPPEELGLTEAVSRLAKGFGTPVSGATADTLPASMRQLIPIVRAFARDPRVIVMDECNSNLDQFADDLFRQALRKRKGSTTIIMVSQRPSFLALADRTIDLSRNRGPEPITLNAETTPTGRAGMLVVPTGAGDD